MSEFPSLNALLMPIMMICICALNLIWSGRRTESRSSLDGARLLAALTEELYLLSKLYRSNLEFLDRAEVRLLSTRVPLAIFRANVPRLTLLDEDTVRCVVAVHANNEHVEMMVAERAKSIKNGPSTVYVFDTCEPSIEDFRALFEEGLSLVDHAIETLEAKREVPEKRWLRATANAAGLLGFSAPKPNVAELIAPETPSIAPSASESETRVIAIERAL